MDRATGPYEDTRTGPNKVLKFKKDLIQVGTKFLQIRSLENKNLISKKKFYDMYDSIV